MKKTLRGHWVFAYKNMKTKEKTSRVIPKVVGVAYESSLLWELLLQV